MQPQSRHLYMSWCWVWQNSKKAHPHADNLARGSEMMGETDLIFPLYKDAAQRGRQDGCC
jgi:hypothetical protein